MAMSEVIETRNGRIWLGDDGIVRYVTEPGTEETLDTAKETIAAILTVSKGKKRPLLVDIHAIKSITREAREFFGRDERERELTAIALLVGSPVSRIIGSVFIGINRPPNPLKLFTSEGDAIEWLKAFLK
ncbi:MAG: hypothetical protein PH343_01855 [Nitrospira sp.]|nr:hypothetical protein [Nitrospira sp.]